MQGCSLYHFLMIFGLTRPEREPARMFTLSGAPSTTSHFGYLHLVHSLGSPLGYCTLVFDLMRNKYIHYACIYLHSISTMRSGEPSQPILNVVIWQYYFKVTFQPCWVGLVVSVSVSHPVGREFTSWPGHTKDHHKNGTNCLPAWHEMR